MQMRITYEKKKGSTAPPEHAAELLVPEINSCQETVYAEILCINQYIT